MNPISTALRPFIRCLLALLLAASPLIHAAESPTKSAIPSALAKEILADPELPSVLDKARALLKTGLNAGSGYGEVWIRDLNTFIEMALTVNEPAAFREALLTFFKFQGPTGDIVDGFIPKAKASINYKYRSSSLAPAWLAHKNTVETDQESSLVQAVRKYVQTTGDRSLLQEKIEGESVLVRLGRALEYVMTERFDQEHGLVWGATTVDWGDVQPEHPWGVELDASSHRAIDIYDNAMMVIALNDYLQLLDRDDPDSGRWITRRDALGKAIRRHLWDSAQHKFIPHLYLGESPFPKTFEERSIYYFGGTAVAIEAGLLSPEEIQRSLAIMQAKVKEAGAGSIGLTVYPPYPDGFFKNPSMRPYSYQNGGDWCWFGGRMVQQLIQNGFAEEAYRALQPMVKRVLAAGDFHEWWSLDNQPRGSKQFRGSAGVLGKAITMLLAQARAAHPTATKTSAGPDLFALAQSHRKVHRFSTLFTAHDVRRYLATEANTAEAIDWCRRTGLTKVYLESFRDGYQAERATLTRARDQFRGAGFEVSGCVTTTSLGKRSTGWNIIACYTDPATQDKVRAIFEFTAPLFDEIMIDDFWFTDCACADCDAARKNRTVTVGQRSYPVSGDSWEAYRCELMVRVSQDLVLTAAKKVNPHVRVIIKYPQWYDRFHERGYEVTRETADFDRIWVGTETRDYEDPRWGGTVQYEAYFIMRWLSGIGGEKTGGGWYDWLGTTERTYLEQARQTILGGARESLLFCFGGLQKDTGPKNVEALRLELPELWEVARQVATRTLIGVATYKPPNSHPEQESRIFDFVGMMGLPLVPTSEFPENGAAAFFSVHALKDPHFIPRLRRFLAAGKPVLLTDGLAARLEGSMNLKSPHVRILPVKGDPQSLLNLGQEELASLRSFLLAPLKIGFNAPNKLSLIMFQDGSWVAQNFGDEDADTVLNGHPLRIPGRGWKHHFTP